MSNKITIYQL